MFCLDSNFQLPPTDTSIFVLPQSVWNRIGELEKLTTDKFCSVIPNNRIQSPDFDRCHWWSKQNNTPNLYQICCNIDFFFLIFETESCPKVVELSHVNRTLFRPASLRSVINSVRPLLWRKEVFKILIVASAEFSAIYISCWENVGRVERADFQFGNLKVTRFWESQGLAQAIAVHIVRCF